MKHPILRNPAKWLQGVEKGHSSHLYLSKFYDPQLLAANPFANALVSTRKDVSNVRFPLGNMTQIVVQKQGELDYQLVPVLEKPTKGQNPASYVLANHAYIDFISKRHFKPIPLKYRHRSPIMANSIKTPENFSLLVDSMLLERIQTLLGQVETSESSVSESNPSHLSGIMIAPSSTTSGWWENGTYHVVGPFCSKKAFVPYIGHEQLCGTLCKYVRYKSITSTRSPATPRS